MRNHRTDVLYAVARINISLFSRPYVKNLQCLIKSPGCEFKLPHIYRMYYHVHTDDKEIVE